MVFTSENLGSKTMQLLEGEEFEEREEGKNKNRQLMEAV